MGIFDFVKDAGKMIGMGGDSETPEEQDARARQAKAASNAARAEAQAEAEKAKAATGTMTAPAPLTTAAIEAKIKASKLKVKDLALKLEGDDQIKVYGVVESPDDKADLILLVGNTPGVAKVDDAIKVRKPGSDKDEDEAKVPAPRFYQVRSGDTLSGIAQKELGDAGRYMEIFNANRNILRDPDQIDIGQTLRIPNR